MRKKLATILRNLADEIDPKPVKRRGRPRKRVEIGELWRGQPEEPR